MKDYYSRLDLPSTATKREIEAELPTLDDAALRRKARFVLLDPERRATYDQCHRALRQIAFLRANLGLNRSPFWLLSNCEDFNAEPFSGRRPEQRRSLTKPLLVFLFALLAAWGLFEISGTGSTASVRPDRLETPLALEPGEGESIGSPDPTPEIAGRRSAEEWNAWHEAFRTEVAPVKKAWRELTRSLDRHSFEIAESRCRALQKAVQRCDRSRLLPSPELELDGAISLFLDHLTGAARSCRGQRFFEMTEELDSAQEGWDRIERRLRYQAIEP